MTARALELDTATFKDAQHARTCSIVVPTIAEPLRLERCLEALHALDFAPTDVIVVDNSGGDDSTRGVARRWGALYVVEGRSGVGRLLDRGTLVSSSDIIAYADPRAMPTSGWLRALLAPFADPLVMAAAGSSITRRAMHSAASSRLLRRSTTVGNIALRRTVFDGWPGFHNIDRRWPRTWSDMQGRALSDLLRRGYKVSLVRDATVRVESSPGMIQRALASIETRLGGASPIPPAGPEPRSANISNIPPHGEAPRRLQRLER